MNNDIYTEYALIDAQIKELTAKKDTYRTAIIKDMVENGQEKIKHIFGSFSVSKLESYEYPQYVIDLNEDYKAAKALSQETKEAICTETDGLRFTPAKI